MEHTQKQDIKSREKESALLDAQQEFLRFRKRSREEFEQRMKLEEDKWKLYQNSACSLDEFSNVSIPINQKKILSLSPFKLKCRIVIPPDASVDSILSFLKSPHSYSVDLSKVKSKEWMQHLPLLGGSKVHCLLIQGQELRTKEDISLLATFVQNTKNLRELHLEDNKLELESLFPLSSVLLNGKRKLLKVYLSGNPITKGKPLESFSLVAASDDWENVLTFRGMEEGKIFLANPHGKLDQKHVLWFPDFFRGFPLKEKRNLNPFSVPVIKLGGLLYLFGELPSNLSFIPGEEPHLPMDCRLIRVETMFPPSQIEMNVSEMKTGESGFIYSWKMTFDMKGTFRLTEGESWKVLEYGVSISSFVTVVGIEDSVHRNIKIIRKEDGSFLATMQKEIYKEILNQKKLNYPPAQRHFRVSEFVLVD